MTLVFYKSLIVYFLSDKEAKKQTTVHHLCILQANRSGYTYTQEDMYGDSVSQSVKGTPLLEYHTPKQGAHGPHSQSTLISFKYVLRVSLHLPMQMEMHLLLSSGEGRLESRTSEVMVVFSFHFPTPIF